MISKKKKIRKLRGSRTHGWGLTHRGKGNKGGSGKSGAGKKCHSKKHMFPTNHLGKKGFKKKNKEKYKSISIKELTEKLDKLVEQKLIQKKGDTYEINLEKLGYGKLLSQGKLEQKLNIKVKRVSERAKKKIEEKGGKITNADMEANIVQSS